MLRHVVLVVLLVTFATTTDGWWYSHDHDHEEIHDKSHDESNENETFSREENHEDSKESSTSPVKTIVVNYTTDASKPYYFGSTGLTCLLMHHLLHKRSTHEHEVNTWSYSHSFLYYDNFHFELGKDSHVYYDSELPSDDMCHSTTGMEPTGYSIIDVNCIKNCSDNYVAHYGAYNFFTNNCHLFVNRMAKILDGHHCPAWCEN